MREKSENKISWWSALYLLIYFLRVPWPHVFIHLFAVTLFIFFFLGSFMQRKEMVSIFLLNFFFRVIYMATKRSLVFSRRSTFYFISCFVSMQKEKNRLLLFLGATFLLWMQAERWGKIPLSKFHNLSWGLLAIHSYCCWLSLFFRSLIGFHERRKIPLAVFEWLNNTSNTFHPHVSRDALNCSCNFPSFSFYCYRKKGKNSISSLAHSECLQSVFDARLITFHLTSRLSCVFLHLPFNRTDRQTDT